MEYPILAQIIIRIIAGRAQNGSPNHFGGSLHPNFSTNCVNGPHGEYIMTHMIDTATTLDIYGMNKASRKGNLAKQYLSIATARTSARHMVSGTVTLANTIVFTREVRNQLSDHTSM